MPRPWLHVPRLPRPCKARGGQTQDPKEQQLQTHSTCLYQSPKAWQTCCSHITKGLRLYWPKSKTKAQAKAQATAVAAGPAQVPKTARVPMEAPE